MVNETRDFKIPSRLVPQCPVCGKPMTMHLRMENKFVEDDIWHERYGEYQKFLHKAKRQKLVLLELGVGFNTPGIIRYAFERMAADNPDTTLIRINMMDANVSYIELQNIIPIQADLKETIAQLK